MYHIVYLTTNLVNQKFYVGVHSTYNLNDGYLGKGSALKLAIKKYGKKSFKRIVLHYCISREHAFEIESQIVDESFLQRTDIYNLSVGGIGYVNEHNVKYNIGKKHSYKTKQKISDANKGSNNGMYGIKRSEEFKEKNGKLISESLLKSDKLKSSRQSIEYRTKQSELQSFDKTVLLISENGDIIAKYENLSKLAEKSGYTYANIKNARRFKRPIGVKKTDIIKIKCFVVYEKDYQK